MVNITVNGRAISARDGATILEACRENGIEIPTLCFLKEINDIGSCRICMVEVEGYDYLLASCRTKISEGMSIITESEKIPRYRKEMLRLILSVIRFVLHARALMDRSYLYLLCVRNAKGQLVPVYAHFDRIAHGSKLYELYLGSGYDSHVQQMLAKSSLSSDRFYDR